MASPTFSISNSILVLLSLLLSSIFPSTVLSVNVTALLASYPDLSAFAHLLAAPSIAGDLQRRSSLTLLAVPNSFLLRSSSSAAVAGDMADVVRYHVLLQYLSPKDLLQIPSSGRLITTLYQTTGRATDGLGAVNLTRSAYGSVTVRSLAPFSPSNATILSLVKTLPYNVSIFAVDSLLVPYGSDLTASENRPPAALNITRILFDGHDFNVAASMLAASGVVEEFEEDEKGAGITVFVATDSAFAELPETERLQSLPADQKATVLRFHALHSYYPLGSLQSIVNPVQPTLATEDTGAGQFTLNISRVNGSVAIDTGIVQVSITRTVFDQNPVAVFAISKVLLPREIFGTVATRANAAVASPPEVEGGYPPEGSLSVQTPPTRFSSPPGMIRSSGWRRKGEVFRSSSDSIFFCTVFLCLLLLL